MNAAKRKIRTTAPSSQVTRVAVSANGSVWLGSCPTAIEAGISRGVLIIIVSTAALHTPLPTWVISVGSMSAACPLLVQ
jgi:hypothetical protein